MRDILPDISVVPRNVDLPEFLKRLEGVARQSSNLVVENVHGYDEFGEGDMLKLSPAAKGRHRGLFGQVIYHTRYKLRIMFRMRAQCWEPDPVTYEVYVAEAMSLFSPLIKIYNKKYGSRLRLYVQPKGSLEPKLPPTATKAFDRFVSNANKTVLHLQDWEDFYGFVCVCHRRRVNISSDDLFRLLVTAGFSEKRAQEIAIAYGHCYGALNIYSGRPYLMRKHLKTARGSLEQDQKI